ncbi:MAG: hypothetical protein HZA50_17900 [Planctomycetes bacterium]|nr:hypothetical protein [Planctomycetota bacterium]
MTAEMTMDVVETVNREFWEDDLQLCLDPWLSLAKDRNYMRAWVAGLTKRQLQILSESLGLDGGGGLQKQREALVRCDGQLIPYFLVDRYAYRRSKFATADYASTVLPEKVMEICRSGEGGHDIVALLFAIYRKDSAHLRTLYQLERIHSTGFARMKLKETVRRPVGSFMEFLTKDVVKHILTEFDRDKNDGRTSEFKNIVPHAGHHLLFIRREEQRSVLLKSRHAIHGFRPEWIILNFRDNGKGVDISSLSMSVPLEIANRLASAYFGQKCEYENEVQVTYKAQIVKILNLLRTDECDFLRFVEVVVGNSPLDGAPVVRISNEESESIAESIRHFEKTVGKVMDDIDLIKSIKVLYCGKRVKIMFERVENVEEGYVVRYHDAVLNAKQRRMFETKLREEPYGLRILSTEKRHKQR